MINPNSSIPFIRPWARGDSCGLVPSLLTAIVLVLPGLTSVGRAQELRAERIQSWDFQRNDDRNVDLEPDGWRRRRDRAHPAYVGMKIAPRDEQRAQSAKEEQILVAKVMHAIEVGKWEQGYIPEIAPPALVDFMDRHLLDNCLEISMDGGAAELVSPTFPIDSRFSYNLEADVSCETLDGHRAWIEFHLLDSDGRTIAQASTPEIEGNQAWMRVSASIASGVTASTRQGRVLLKVAPRENRLSAGKARFDAISILRLPRLTLSTDLPRHIARPGVPFEVTCLAMGVNAECPNVKFQLRNCLDELLREDSVALVPAELDAPGSNMVERYVSTSGPRSGKSSEESQRHADDSITAAAVGGFDAFASWTLDLATPGLYRVRVDLGTAGDAQRREMLIGVMGAGMPVHSGPFGWSIRAFDGGLSPEELASLVEQFGAGWMRYPIWFDSADVASADRLVKMTERLQSLGIECVGRLDFPPGRQRQVFGDGDKRLPAVTIFRQADLWEPLLEPVLTRMGLKLDWFQLGADNDTSFMGVPDVEQLLIEIRGRMQSYCQELRLALNWTWLDPQPDLAGVAWNAVNYRISPPLTAQELLNYSRTASGERRTEQWIHIDPLPASEYELLDRVRDLTERMVAVKQSAVQAAFISDPFDSEQGLFDSNRNLGELLIPWTSLVSAIGNARYAGSIRMPSGSQNHIFEKGDQGILLMWNDTATTEQNYFGDSISVSDVWGQTWPVTQDESSRGTPEQRFDVDAWPRIVRGIDLNLIRWQQAFSLEIDNLATNANRQDLPMDLRNTLGQSAVGRITLNSDSLLLNGRSEMPLQLSAGVTHSRRLPIALRPDASAGVHQLRFDFDLQAGRPYHFSLYRTLTLGMGDIEFRWDLTREGAKTVKLRCELINNTEDTVSFDCKLFPAGSPYQRFQILDVKPGSSLSEYTITMTPDQQANQAWIRCEQIGQGRVLNYRLGGE